MALFFSIMVIVMGGNYLNHKGATHPEPSHFDEQIRK